MKIAETATGFRHAQARAHDDALADLALLHSRAALSHIGLGQRGAGVEEHVARLRQQVLAQCRSSVFMALAIASKPVGTLKYTVGAISRRLRNVSPISAGVGLPSSMYSVPPL